MSQINALQEEIEEMREEQERLEKKIEHLEETLEIKEDETTQLGEYAANSNISDESIYCQVKYVDVWNGLSCKITLCVPLDFYGLSVYICLCVCM